jgi:hypothetical protein
MEPLPELYLFYKAIASNPRIGPTHISLYMALFQQFNQNGFRNPVAVTRKKSMELAKISGNATFHKCMKDLVACGYIDYRPSFNPFGNSLVYFKFGEIR